MQPSDRISELMRNAKLKPRDLVNRLGVSKGSVSQWINGLTTPKGENLIYLAEMLQTTPEYILTGKQTQSVGQSVSIANVKKAALILRNSESLNGQNLSNREFVKRLGDLVFRLEKGLDFADLVSVNEDSTALIKQASMLASMVYKRVEAKHGDKLTEDNKHELFSEIFKDCYSSVVADNVVDPEKYKAV